MCNIKTKLEQINKYIENVAEKISMGETFNDGSNELISCSQNINASKFNKDTVLKGEIGIYVFAISKNYANDYEKFNNCDHGAKLTKHLNKQEFEIGDILYVGKSENLHLRLKEHLESCHPATYSLRLYDQSRASIIPCLEIRCYFIKNDLREYYTIIGRKLEKAVAGKYEKLLLTDNK